MRKQVVVPVRRPAGPPRRRSASSANPEWSPWIRRWSSSLSITPIRSWTSSEAPDRTRPSGSRPASSLLTRCRSWSSCRSIRSSRSSRNRVARRSSTDSRAAPLDGVEDLLPLGLGVPALEHVAGQVPGQPDAGREHQVAGRPAGVQPADPAVGEQAQVDHSSTRRRSRSSAASSKFSVSTASRSCSRRSAACSPATTGAGAGSRSA